MDCPYRQSASERLARSPLGYWLLPVLQPAHSFAVGVKNYLLRSMGEIGCSRQLADVHVYDLRGRTAQSNDGRTVPRREQLGFIPRK